MTGHLLDLDLLEMATALVETLLDVPLQYLLSCSVFLNELGGVFRTVKGQTQGYFVCVSDHISLQIAQLDLQTE